MEENLAMHDGLQLYHGLCEEMVNRRLDIARLWLLTLFSKNL